MVKNNRLLVRNLFLYICQELKGYFTGQVASLTSTNNYINFCLLSQLPLTNGKQVTTGSCNGVPMGNLPSVDNTPSAKIAFPKNFATIPANQQFTFQLNIAKLTTGSFTNAQLTYFSAPQNLDGSGNIVGHSHITCDALSAIDQTTPTNSKEFVFFKVYHIILTIMVINNDTVGFERQSSEWPADCKR